MAAAWLLARPGGNAALWTLACGLTFWAHEPLLVLLGRRGRRELAQRGRRALRLVCLLLLAAMTAVLAAVLLPPAIPWAAFLPAMALGAIASLLAAAGSERSLAGELTAGLALVWASLPVALAGTLSAAPALALTLLWSCAMAAGMLGVRGIVARAKHGSRASGLAAVQVALAGLVPALALAVARLLPLRFALAPAPVAAVSVAWVWRPPAPRSLRRAGVLLVAANLAALALLLA